eukprot:NODE_12841_length_222_cov_24.734104_g11071_i0.p1 GENE.NODE_12841_length_222_cov_24.734104_g11071_i0~~NODE_12841_length_222_cov_24.734104_g11071_i0.p1  ORF type:complete len:68 (-),score=18.58 NODE_12841_length_222_cov_24.734104_g11071_i0:18-191(-)
MGVTACVVYTHIYKFIYIYVCACVWLNAFFPAWKCTPPFFFVCGVHVFAGCGCKLLM